MVEDMDADAYLARAALADLDDQLIIIRVPNVELALKFFFKTAEYSATPKADLVLLDINLAGESGYDLLEIMRGDDGLKGIPVVVFSTSARQIDKQKSLSLGALAHFGKPWTYTGYEETMREIVQLMPRSS
jgi:two-component system, chemotaxis family, response regulator Rcp1